MADPGVREVRTGGTLTLQALGFPPGQTPSVRLLRLDDGTIPIAATTAGVTEDSPGNYDWQLQVPDDLAAGNHAAEWDFGQGWVRDDDIVQVTSAPAASGLTPTVAEVGNLLRARTKDRNGNELGTFTVDTRPTGDQVAALVAQARNGVVDAAGGEFATVEHEASARFLVAVATGMLVELSYFPEQASQTDSIYERLRDLYEAQLRRLVESLLDPTPGAHGFASLPIRSPTATLHEAQVGVRW